MSSSLVVRIGADLSDFSKQLNKMTKDVREAAQTIADVGKSMTIGITVSVGLAAVALSHMALENETVAKKMEQTFGPALSGVNDELERMMELVPETQTDLQKMAVKTNDLAKGLGMATPKAALLTTEMMKMAANISASKVGVGMGDALDALEKGLAGQTRGLKSMGIVIEQAQVKQEAYRLGLIRTGQELTPLGTALATYSLLVKQASQFQGEAGRVNQNVARQWEFLKRDLSEFADVTSNLLLPALQALIAFGRTFVAMLNTIPSGVREVIIMMAVMAATIGPLLIVIAKLTEAIMVLRVAMTLLAEGSAMKKLLGMLTDPKMLLVVVALAVALGGAIALWKKFHKEVIETPKIEPLIDIDKLLGGITGDLAGDPMSQLKKSISNLVESYTRAVAAGRPFAEQLDEIKRRRNEIGFKVNNLLAENGGKETDAIREQLNAYRELYDQLTQIANLSYAMSGGPKLIVRASQALKSDTAIAQDITGQQVSDETALRVREAAVRMADVFNAVRVASLDYAEDLRRVRNEFALTWARFKKEWSNPGQSAMAGLKEAVGGIIASFGPMAIVVKIISKIMEGLGPTIEAVFEPFVVLGQILGAMITPYLRILFNVLKPVIYVISILGEIIARVSAAIATGIGKLLIGIGNLLNKLPGSIGNPLKAAGEGMLSFAKDQYKSADEMKRIRQSLGSMTFEDARDGVDALGDAAKRTAEELSGLPEVFKYQLRKYQAVTALDYTPTTTRRDDRDADPTTRVTRRLPDATPLANVVLDSKVIAQITWGHVRAAAVRQYGSTARILDVVVI